MQIASDNSIIHASPCSAHTRSLVTPPFQHSTRIQSQEENHPGANRHVQHRQHYALYEVITDEHFRTKERYDAANGSQAHCTGTGEQCRPVNDRHRSTDTLWVVDHRAWRMAECEPGEQPRSVDRGDSKHGREIEQEPARKFTMGGLDCLLRLSSGYRWRSVRVHRVVVASGLEVLRR